MIPRNQPLTKLNLLGFSFGYILQKFLHNKTELLNLLKCHMSRDWLTCTDTALHKTR